MAKYKVAHRRSYTRRSVSVDSARHAAPYLVAVMADRGMGWDAKRIRQAGEGFGRQHVFAHRNP